MTMEERAAYAVECKHRGYNCCQAVTAALADRCDMSEEQLRILSSGFGLGMGDQGGTCGALVGAGMVAGLRCGGAQAMRYARQISQLFREASGAVVCGQLKGRDTGVVLCSCDDCIRNAVRAYARVMEPEE